MADPVDPASLDPMRDQSPAPTTQGMQQDSQGDIWSRIQDALKRGLISSEQYQQLAARMGYTPQNVGQTPTNAAPGAGKLGGNFATGVKDPNYASSSNPASNVGDAAANLITRGGNAIKNGITSAMQPPPPGAPLDINAPSPAWNQ